MGQFFLNFFTHFGGQKIKTPVIHDVSVEKVLVCRRQFHAQGAL